MPNGRIKFETADGVAGSPAFGSVIVKLGLCESRVEIIDLGYDKELESLINKV